MEREIRVLREYRAVRLSWRRSTVGSSYCKETARSMKSSEIEMREKKLNKNKKYG